MTYTDLLPPNPNPDFQAEARISALYQRVGDLERSLRFYDLGYVEEAAERTVSGATITWSNDLQVSHYVDSLDQMVAYQIDAEMRFSVVLDHSGSDYLTIWLRNTSYPDTEALRIDQNNVYNPNRTAYSRFTTGGGAMAANWPRGAFNAYRPLSAPAIHTFQLGFSCATNLSVTKTGYIRNLKFWSAVV